MDKSIQELMDDTQKLINIKKHFFNVGTIPSEEDIKTLEKLSQKGFLMASFLLGVAHVFGLSTSCNPYEADRYFDSLIKNKDTDKSILFQIANYYVGMGEEWKDKAMIALNLAASKGHPLAIRMVEEMEKNPFNIIKA